MGSKLNKNLDDLSLNEYYEILISELSNYLGYSKQETDLLMRFKFLNREETIDNEDVMFSPKVSELNESEFVEYLDKVKQWAGEFGFKFDQ